LTSNSYKLAQEYQLNTGILHARGVAASGGRYNAESVGYIQDRCVSRLHRRVTGHGPGSHAPPAQPEVRPCRPAPLVPPVSQQASRCLYIGSVQARRVATPLTSKSWKGYVITATRCISSYRHTANNPANSRPWSSRR